MANLLARLANHNLMGVIIPDKMYFKIGEVAQIAAIKPSVLRFWETEFVFLHPEKSTKGQRLYSRQEVELILQVRQLLYEERFTIEGVKQRISPKGKLRIVTDTFNSNINAKSIDATVLLQEIKLSLQALRSKL